MEVSVVTIDIPSLVNVKHEMDESIKADSKNESGVYSDNSSNFDKPNWEVWEGEICDYEIFNPPTMCSSNVWGEPMIRCDWSSIFELTPADNSKS